jgi:hypothetical protein
LKQLFGAHSAKKISLVKFGSVVIANAAAKYIGGKKIAPKTIQIAGQ